VDPWGVVANEACAAGVPVIVTPFAGVSGELVVDGETGSILPLDVEAWAQTVTQWLSDDALYARLSSKCRQVVKPYNFENATQGMANGIRQGLSLAPAGR
jgi:glycosyltransferase involved in cell wall biosynthesis